jgi:succinate dehydrogenase / fumarate reductase flavoprotein subunit
MMQKRVGIVRIEADMASALDGINRLHQRASQVHVVGNREYNPAWHTALDLQPLLTIAEAITRAALKRRESRGAHFRQDFPTKDEGLGKNRMVIRKDDDGAMRIEQIAIPELPAELKTIIEEMK